MVNKPPLQVKVLYAYMFRIFEIVQPNNYTMHGNNFVQSQNQAQGYLSPLPVHAYNSKIYLARFFLCSYHLIKNHHLHNGLIYMYKLVLILG